MPSKSKLVELVTTVLLSAISLAVALAALILKLLILLDISPKACYIFRGNKKKEGISNSVWILGKRLSIEGFYKCSFYNNIFNAIKGATRPACLSLVVGIGVLGLLGKSVPGAVGFCKHCNM